MTVVDAFAGPGGWDIAAQHLGLDPVGIEHDPDTCSTRAAAGLRTIRADLTEYEPPHKAHITGLIASPPCPDFSIAGDGSARPEIEGVCGSIREIGCVPDCYSVSSQLVGLPVLWALRHRPQWIALEQVPPVLPIWEATAHVLEREGWHTWTGILNAADYGVPQTRKRAFLIARRDRPVRPPEATHAQHPQPTLFGDAPERWISMGEALGLATELEVRTGQMSKMGGGTTEVYTRSTDRPSPTLTGKSVGQWKLNQYDERTNEHGQPYRRQAGLDEPAPTITTKVNRWEWKLDPRENGYGPMDLDGPARTLTGSAVNNWVFRRPATTVTGDPRIWPPGHKVNQDDIDRLGEAEAERRYGGDRAGSEAIKVTIDQAAALQSFPHDYPFQGSKSSQAKQIGNAVPLLLAYHVLKDLAA